LPSFAELSRIAFGCLIVSLRRRLLPSLAVVYRLRLLPLPVVAFAHFSVCRFSRRSPPSARQPVCLSSVNIS
jgi:hypothetical protein